MGFGTNLTFATKAVDYVKSKMTVGASNKVMDVVSTGFGSALCVMAMRGVQDEAEWEPAREDQIPGWLVRVAAIAESAGCGNCGEQAALAFVHLYRELKVRPVHMMSRTGGVDHAFVVIGRAAGSKDGDYKTWGDAAVVCDPWHGKAYAARDIPKEAYKPEPFGVETEFGLET
jgi:hypothetical protein